MISPNGVQIELDAMGNIKTTPSNAPIKLSEKKEEKKFRLDNQRLLLTYSTHIDKQALLDFINKWKPVTYYCIVHESGGQGTYPHTHAAIDFGKNVQSTKARILDYKGIHPNIKVLPGKKAFLDALRYLAKDDPEPFHNIDDDIKTTWVDRVLSCETILEALAKFKPTECRGVEMVFGLKEPKTRKDPEPTMPWYNQWKEIVNNAQPREIVWTYDKYGKSGKSWITSYLLGESKDTYCVTEFGRSTDFAHNIAIAIKEGWTCKLLIVDLPRTMEDRDSIYTCLENCINGVITTTKYSGRTIKMAEKPKIAVFANFLPKVERMSNDRWSLHALVGGFEGELIKLETPKINIRPSKEAELEELRQNGYLISQPVLPTKERNSSKSPLRKRV